MIPTAFDYERATSLDDAIAKLAAAGGAGKIIAGGHSLVPLMKLRLSEPAVLIDVAHIPDFAGIREADGLIEIGAGTTHHDVATSPLLRERCPVVAETAALIGDPQVRNRGTLGGSLAHADPAADYPASLLAVDGERPPEGSARGLARRQRPRLLSGHVDRRPGGGRSSREGDVRPAARGGVRQAPPACVALRHRRRGGGAGGARRCDRGGPRRPDRGGGGAVPAGETSRRRSRGGRPLPKRFPRRPGSPATASRTSTTTSTPARSTAAP